MNIIRRVKLAVAVATRSLLAANENRKRWVYPYSWNDLSR